MGGGGNLGDDGEHRIRSSTISGQSVSTSGSVGSPSTDKTFLRLNHLNIQDDDAKSHGSTGKKKRAQRAVAGDKGGRGLRQFSMKVCEKVESKGRTTYNEVADELVAEFSDPSYNMASPDQQQYDEKNIRRRVYDALNVLMAMDIISKDKKEIQWKGLPKTSMNDIEELKTEHLGRKCSVEKKAAYLQELEDQFIGLQNLVKRNEQLYGSENPPGSSKSGGVALPFILVQTKSNATVEVEISEDMQLVHFDLNSTPFELHDDNHVLKSMKLCERGEGSSMSNSRSNPQVKPPNTPGIIKGRFKHEQ